MKNILILIMLLLISYANASDSYLEIENACMKNKTMSASSLYRQSLNQAFSATMLNMDDISYLIVTNGNGSIIEMTLSSRYQSIMKKCFPQNERKALDFTRKFIFINRFSQLIGLTSGIAINFSLAKIFIKLFKKMPLKAKKAASFGMAGASIYSVWSLYKTIYPNHNIQAQDLFNQEDFNSLTNEVIKRAKEKIKELQNEQALITSQEELKKNKVLIKKIQEQIKLIQEQEEENV